MLTASRALTTAADSEALPRVQELEQLHAYGFMPRRGQLLMVAGQPGAGKSTFTNWYAMRLGLPALIFSADQDSFTSITRLAAAMTGYTIDNVSQAVNSGGFGYFSDILAESKIQFCFDSSPTLDDMADELSAYVELWDRYPDIIVVDNLLNIEAELGEEFAGLRLVAKELHRMARETNAAVIVVHHTREESDPSCTPSRREIQGKVAQLPERILTVAYNQDEGSFRIAPVKNRGGRQDPTGKQFFRLSAYPDRASFGPYMGHPYGGSHG